MEKPLQVFIEFDDPQLKPCFDAYARATAVFKQIEQLFYIVKEDLLHRKKCNL